MFIKAELLKVPQPPYGCKGLTSGFLLMKDLFIKASLGPSQPVVEGLSLDLGSHEDGLST